MQRLPCLVCLAKSFEMMLTSKPVKGEEALSLALVDAIATLAELISTARHWALDILECRKPWVASLYMIDKLEPLGEAREILKEKVKKACELILAVVEQVKMANFREALITPFGGLEGGKCM